MRTVVEVALAVSAILGAVSLIGVVVMRPLRRTLGQLREFLDDWRGEPARPGSAARPGVPERLAAIEQRTTEVEREVRTNGGSTLRDRAESNRNAIRDLAGKLDAHLRWAHETTKRLEGAEERRAQ
jgi:hypothetical protein